MRGLMFRRLSVLAMFCLMLIVGCRHSRCRHCTCCNCCTTTQCADASAKPAVSKDAVVTPVGLKSKNSTAGVVAVTVYAPSSSDSGIGAIVGTFLMSRANAEAMGLRPGYSPNVMIVSEEDPKALVAEKPEETTEKASPGLYLP